ncbi:aryl-alcohol dehydrogenase-like predicted oxidoreductase [Bradyrhizobium sp. S3.2.6]
MVPAICRHLSAGSTRANSAHVDGVTRTEIPHEDQATILAADMIGATGATLTQPSDSIDAMTCLAEIAVAHGASISQVALNWLLARDSHTIPIPGATNRAGANLDALGWR